MKLLFIAGCFLITFVDVVAQHVPIIQVASFEYVWSRQAGDVRLVFAKDSRYRDAIKRSFTKAISAKWNIDTPGFSINVTRLPAIRTEPKFKPSVANQIRQTAIFLSSYLMKQ